MSRQESQPVPLHPTAPHGFCVPDSREIGGCGWGPPAVQEGQQRIQLPGRAGGREGPVLGSHRPWALLSK